jgi:pimeloyl-ACP methyl ester carboxylesterase
MKREFVSVGGASLETVWHGPEDANAPVVVMLHEGLGSVSLWRDFPAAIAAATGARVCVFSRAGYGQSSRVNLPRPVDYLHREALDVLPEFLDAIGFRRGILLGHSDGGSIATIYAGSVQDHRVRALALIEPHFFMEEINLSAIRRTTAEFRSSDLREKLGRHHADVDNAFDGWSGAWLDPGFAEFDLREELGYIRVPILLVKGEHDPYSTMEQLNVAVAETYCPVEAVVIRDAGHSPHREKPAETLGIVAGFINRILWSHGEAGAAAKPPAGIVVATT